MEVKLSEQTEVKVDDESYGDYEGTDECAKW